MSVINRMLADLERRGAPGARRLGATGAPARGRGSGSARRRQWLARLAPVLLLVALVVVAGALWQRHWPEIRRWASAASEPAPAARAAGEPAREPVPPRVTGFRFEPGDGATRLVVAFDAALPEPPGYGRSGDRLGLRVPAHWDAGSLPGPPAGQSVFQAITLDARGDASTRIGITVDPEARFDLDHDGRRLVLTGRLPEGQAAPATAGSDAKNGQDETRTAAADDAQGREDPEPTRTADAEQVDNGISASGGSPERAGAQAGEAGRSANGGSASEGAAATDAGGGDDGATMTASAKPATADTGTEADTGAETAGTVRKSAPDVSPGERARRLESAARRALDNGNVAKARGYLVDALARDPDRHSARDLLMAIYLRRGDAAAARKLLAEGVARAPRRTAYAKPFARLLVDAGDLERAYRVLERAAPAAADDAGYHGLMAAVAQRLDRHEAAASAYTRALELDGDRGLWWMGLGISLRETDHPAEALAAFREARASGDLNERLDRWVQKQIEALSDSAQ